MKYKIFACWIYAVFTEYIGMKTDETVLILIANLLTVWMLSKGEK